MNKKINSKTVNAYDIKPKINISTLFVKTNQKKNQKMLEPSFGIVEL